MELKAVGIPARGEEIGGKYRVEKVIGQGGMGAVFAARNVVTGKRVAIKWLWPEHAGSVNRERLLREAQLAGSVEHPNIVDIYDVGEHHGGLFLVMEYLPGRPLSELILERGRLDPHELIPLLVPAMRGVHAAHLAGVIHRDLKPENIILCQHEGGVIPKVVDFGVSKVTALSAIPDASLTRAGALVGTPQYMALEQINGSSVIDPRTDVYAFGVLLYHGLTGSYPFNGATISEIILRIGTTEAPSLRSARPELPEELDKVVQRALARNFESRFGSLEELARAVIPFAGDMSGRTSWQGVLSPSAISPHSLEVPIMSAVTSKPLSSEVTLRTEPTSRLTKQRIVIGAIAAIVVLVGGGLLLRGMRGPSPTEAASVSSKTPSTAVSPAQKGSVAPSGAEHSSGTKPSRVAPSSEEPVTSKKPAVTLERAPRQGDSEARPSPKRATATGGRQRDLAGPETSRDSNTVIPGKRTNGLSVDDF
jgi:eukaryotic-like serine/threonine-protein kinase